MLPSNQRNFNNPTIKFTPRKSSQQNSKDPGYTINDQTQQIAEIKSIWSKSPEWILMQSLISLVSPEKEEI